MELYNDFEFSDIADLDAHLEVIKVVSFSEIIAGEIGEYIDTYFDSEGWELQLVCNFHGNRGYQVFFGRDVYVDGYYQYGFPYLFDLNDVVEFALDFYQFKKII